MDERVSIRGNTKPLRKYGSISNNTNFVRNEHYIKHVVTETDTLQGLALKYSVTVNTLLIWYFQIIYNAYYILLVLLLYI